ncbi:hypothetical protein BLNAU_21482 [Blattamonas nauphoetae]|uniref:Uncharacterized protein n=1 Tax=Blattamonas nauphoetae TaxID=2049346 RepID=A0ABQ9WY28_9EUKA|nr:hypothetical protein BLNAU_21482 [Blattamonas nauphoetae]
MKRLLTQTRRILCHHRALSPQRGDRRKMNARLIHFNLKELVLYYQTETGHLTYSKSLGFEPFTSHWLNKDRTRMEGCPDRRKRHLGIVVGCGCENHRDLAAVAVGEGDKSHQSKYGDENIWKGS